MAKKKPMDAIALLKADHRQVEQWFKAYTIEEEIFYPAFITATEDKDLHHEAVVEHDGAKKLIREIAASSPADDYFDAKVKVLSEQIKHQ